VHRVHQQGRYLAAGHANAACGAYRRLDSDRQLESRGNFRGIVVKMTGISALPAFVRGTRLLMTTAPELLANNGFSGLVRCKVPVACPRMAHVPDLARPPPARHCALLF
jgi:hypothetical protein